MWPVGDAGIERRKSPRTPNPEGKGAQGLTCVCLLAGFAFVVGGRILRDRVAVDRVAGHRGVFVLSTAKPNTTRAAV